MLSNNKYNIVRIGDFATKANTKINYCFFSLGLCLEEYITNNSTDSFLLLGYSTLIWTIIEFFLHTSNTRIIKPMVFYYDKNNSVTLPHYLGLFIQGFQEGGFITTLGLYFGDRFYSSIHNIFLHVLISLIVLNVCNKPETTIQTSIRQVNTTGSLLGMFIIILYNIYSLYQYPEHRYRQFHMFFVMMYVSSWWTFAAWYNGFRKVGVYIKDDNDQYVLKKSNIFDTVMVLLYDIFIEIAMAYLTFYNFLI